MSPWQTVGHLSLQTLRALPWSGMHPFRCGLPLPRGQVFGSPLWKIRAADGSESVVAAKPLRLWPDQSWQWAQIDGIAAAEWGRALVAVQMHPAEPSVTARPATAWLNQAEKKGGVTFGQQKIAWDWRRGLCLQKEGEAQNQPWLFIRFNLGVESAFLPHAVRLEANAQRADLIWEGCFAADAQGGHSRLRGTVQATSFPETPLLRIEVNLWNPSAAKHPGGLWDLGDAGSLHLHALGFRWPRNGQAWLQAEPGHDWHKLGEQASLLQGSSGLESVLPLSALAHRGADSNSTVRFEGYKLEKGMKQNTLDGRRANPVMRWEDGGKWEIQPEDFWERFPSSLEVQQNEIRYEPWPLQDAQRYELQGGERTRAVFWIAAQDSVAEWDKMPELLSGARAGVYALPDGPTVAASRALPFFSLQAAETLPPALGGAVLEGKSALQARRESWDEYGWRNFGEVAADHEAEHYQGQWPMVSHYNNQYDMMYGLLAGGLSRGDAGLDELGLRLAEHVRHHDLYHTQQDKAAYNGGYFWHTAHYAHAGLATHRTYSRLAFEGKPLPAGFGGGPANEHNYSSGLLLHYWLTGDTASRDAVLQLARWVTAMQDGRRTPLKWLAGGPTGLATGTRDLDWQGPGRGSGYSLNTLLDAYLADGDETWLAKAERVQEVVSSPEDDVENMGLLHRENRWSYVVYLQMVGRYLEVLHQGGRITPAWERARAVLLRYARWMAKNEYPYLSKPEELEFPTSTWAAQDLRKAAVFALAARFAPADEAAGFSQAAKRFLDAASQDLLKAKDRFCTRNLAITLHCFAVLQAWTGEGPKWNLGLSEPQGPYRPRLVVTPQKTVVLARIKGTIRSAGLKLPLYLWQAWRERRDPWA